MPGPFTHSIDPVLADFGAVQLWWYGLGFALGFAQIHRHLRRHRASLLLSRRQVWTLTLYFAIGVLVGGRLVQVAFDDWPFYREHASLIPAFWLGGMATHGLMLGAATGVWAFSRQSGKSMLSLADALVIPGAVLMGMGRIGNFIDGQIVGSVTDAWWAVKFPDAEGFRHPVVLYDGAKNLLLAAFLIRVRRKVRTPGAVAARFVFWYAFPRIFIDLFRDYPTHRLALGTGQTLNIVMAAAGLVLLAISRRRRTRACPGPIDLHIRDEAPHRWQRMAFACVLLLCLMIPSNWTQDIPSRYGERHPGLRHSALYPPICRSTPWPFDVRVEATNAQPQDLDRTRDRSTCSGVPGS